MQAQSLNPTPDAFSSNNNENTKSSQSQIATIDPVHDTNAQKLTANTSNIDDNDTDTKAPEADVVNKTEIKNVNTTLTINTHSDFNPEQVTQSLITFLKSDDTHIDDEDDIDIPLPNDNNTNKLPQSQIISKPSQNSDTSIVITSASPNIATNTSSDADISMISLPNVALTISKPSGSMIVNMDTELSNVSPNPTPQNTPHGSNMIENPSFDTDKLNIDTNLNLHSPLTTPPRSGKGSPTSRARHQYTIHEVSPNASLPPLSPNIIQQFDDNASTAAVLAPEDYARQLRDLGSAPPTPLQVPIFNPDTMDAPQFSLLPAPSPEPPLPLASPVPIIAESEQKQGKDEDPKFEDLETYVDDTLMTTQTNLLIIGFIRTYCLQHHAQRYEIAIAKIVIKSLGDIFNMKRLWKEMTQQKYNDLMDWLRINGARFDHFELKECNGIYVKSTSNDIEDGTVFAAVPIKCILTRDIAQKSPIGQKLSLKQLRSRQTFLACYLCIERMKGKESFWFPYIQTLPTDFREIPIYYNDDEMDELCGSFTIGKIKDRKESLRSEYDNLIDILEPAGITYDDFVWGRLVVITRVFGIRISNHKVRISRILLLFSPHESLLFPPSDNLC